VNINNSSKNSKTHKKKVTDGELITAERASVFYVMFLVLNSQVG